MDSKIQTEDSDLRNCINFRFASWNSCNKFDNCCFNQNYSGYPIRPGIPWKSRRLPRDEPINYSICPLWNVHIFVICGIWHFFIGPPLKSRSLYQIELFEPRLLSAGLDEMISNPSQNSLLGKQIETGIRA
jgi:hypothetical protein